MTAALAFPETEASQHATPRVGPNAVIQLAAALRADRDGDAAVEVFAAAGALDLLNTPPTDMVPESLPRSLFDALYRSMPCRRADRIAHAAGRRTADYILAHRIPKPVRILFAMLPPGLAAPLLLRSIQRNAWTFAGSGVCRVETGAPAIVEITANPLATPDCAWHSGVFERLFRVLVSRHSVVGHSECCRSGNNICRFEITF